MIQLLGVTVTALYVAIASFVALWVIDRLFGLRVSEEEERMGLDLSEHGAYGYPEQLTPSGDVVTVVRRASAEEAS